MDDDACTHTDMRTLHQHFQETLFQLSLVSSSNICFSSNTYFKHMQLVHNWAVDREVLSRQAILLRAQFEANRKVSNLAEAETMVARGFEKLAANEHPDPYRFSSLSLSLSLALYLAANEHPDIATLSLFLSLARSLACALPLDRHVQGVDA